MERRSRRLNKTRGKARGRKQISPRRSYEYDRPPEFVPTFSLGHIFRFTSGANTIVTSLPITRAMLLNLYTMASTTTAQQRIITAVKLKVVEVWGGMPVLGMTPLPVVVEWLGNNAPSTIHSGTPMGVLPAYVRTSPPKNSSDQWWSISGTSESEVLFKITAPAASIIDVHLSVRFADDEAAVSGENGTSASATAGRVYWNYLDGFASKLLAPMGGVTVLP